MCHPSDRVCSFHCPVWLSTDLWWSALSELCGAGTACSELGLLAECLLAVFLLGDQNILAVACLVQNKKQIKKCNLCDLDISTNRLLYSTTIHYVCLSSRVIRLFLQIDLKKIIPVHSLLLAFGKLIRGEVNLSWVWVKEKTYNFQQLKDFFKTLPRTGRWSTCITIWCKTTRAPRRGQWGRGCPDAPVPAPPPAPAADAGRPGEQCWTCSAWARGLRKHTLLSVWFSVSQLSA